MKNVIKYLLILGLFLCSTGMASAHFTMVFPSDDQESVFDVTSEDFIADLGDEKTVYIIWGHPYEHILFDMVPAPEVSIMKPDGSVEVLPVSEVTVPGQDAEGNDGEFIAYKASFTIDQMGDTLVAVKYISEAEGLIDYTKTFIHCGEEVWEGWDAVVGQQTELIPYARPYGMEEGFVFSGKALYEGKALTDSIVEIEKYHTLEAGREIVEDAEARFPSDPAMVYTRSVKSNAAGEFSYTLDEPGIWYVGATKENEGEYSIRGVFELPVLDAYPFEATPVESILISEEAPDESKAETNETNSKKAPGFGALLGLVSLLAVILLARRK